MACKTRKVCDCGRPATRIRNSEAICARCDRCEAQRIGGGPMNESVGGYNGKRRREAAQLSTIN